jgi:hypothetical protein
MRFVYVTVFLFLFLLMQSVSAQEISGQASCAELTAQQIPFELADVEYIHVCEFRYDCMSEKFFACELLLAAEIVEHCEPSDLGMPES